jgi:hypothetical protein
VARISVSFASLALGGISTSHRQSAARYMLRFPGFRGRFSVNPAAILSNKPSAAPRLLVSCAAALDTASAHSRRVRNIILGARFGKVDHDATTISGDERRSIRPLVSSPRFATPIGIQFVIVLALVLSSRSLPPFKPHPVHAPSIEM